MTRRGFLAAPVLALTARTQSDGFIVSGELAEAGDIGYYSLGPTVSLTIDERYAPTMVKQADALVGKSVELVLRRKL